MVELDIGYPYAVDSSGNDLSYQIDKAPDTANIPYSYVPGNLQMFGSRGFAVDSGIRVDDTQVGSDILWSSSKTNSKTTHPGTFGNFAVYDGKGQLFDSNVNPKTITNDVLNSINTGYVNEMIDTATAVATSRATSACYSQMGPLIDSKVAGMVDNKLDTVPVFTTTHIPIFSTTGQLEDSKVSIDSIVNNISDLQSSVEGASANVSQQVANEVQNMYTLLKSETDANLASVASSLNDNITLATNSATDNMTSLLNNQVTLLKQQDTLLAADIDQLVTYVDALDTNKVNVVRPTTSGNIPMLDSMGQLVDSNLSVQQFQTCATQIQDLTDNQSLLSDQYASTMLLGTNTNNGNAAVFDANGQVYDSQINVNTLSSNVELLSRAVDEKLDVPLTFSGQNVPVFDSTGQLVDSSVNVTNVMMKGANTRLGSTAVFDASGQVIDSGIDLISMRSDVDNALQDLSSSLYIPGTTNPNHVPVFDVTGQLMDSNVNVTTLMPKTTGAQANNIAIFNSDGTVADSSYKIDDSIVTSSNVWTSAMTQTLLNEKIDRPQLFTTGNVAVFDVDGHVRDGGPLPVIRADIPPTKMSPIVTMDAYGVPIESNLTVDSVQVKTIPSYVNNVAVLDANGQVQDSDMGIDDSMAANPNVMWTSAKQQTLLDQKLNTAPLFAAQNIPVFDSTGQLVDSNVNVNMLTMQLDGTIPRVMNVSEPNHVAVLQVDGSVTDSGVNVTQLQTLVVPSNVNNIASFDANGRLKESGITLDDNSSSPSTIWSSDRIGYELDAKMNATSQYTAGHLPMFDSNGNLIDSTVSAEGMLSQAIAECKRECGDKIFTLVPTRTGAIPTLREDGQVSDSNVLVSELQTKTPPSTVNNVAVLDASGQVVDSSYRFNDMQTDPNVVWSSIKTASELDKKLTTPLVFSEENIPVFDSTGQLTDSRISMSSLYTTMDNKIATSAVVARPSALVNHIAVWDGSGQQNDSGVAIENVMLKAQSTPINSVAVFDSDGQVMSNGLFYNDSLGPSADIVWTSAKTQQLLDATATSKLNKPLTSVVGDVPMFDVDGQLMDSGLSAATVKSQLDYLSSVQSQPLVTPTKPNTIPVLGTDGVIVDSQKSFDDVLTKPMTSTLNHIATFSDSGNVQDSGFVFRDDTTTVSNIWSASQVQTGLDKKLNTFTLYNAGNVPIIGSDGQLLDGNTSLASLVPPIPTQANNMTMLSADGRLLDSTISRDSLLTVPTTFKANNLTYFDSQGKIVDSLYSVDDASQPSTQIIYSSGKLTSLIDEKLTKPATYTPNDIGMFDASGQLVDSGILVTSLATKTDLSSYQLKQNATAGNLAVWNPDQQTVDSYVKIDDNANPSPSVLYTSQRLLTKPAIPGVQGNLASFDSSGQIVDSTYHVDDSAAPNVTILYSSSKMDQLNSLKLSAPSPAATSGNITVFGPNNNVIDSGVSLQSLEGAIGGTSIPVVPSATSGNISVFNTTGGVIDSLKRMDDTAPPSVDVIYSSVRVAEKMSKVAQPFTEGNIPILNSNGELVDSGQSPLTISPPDVMKLVSGASQNEIAFLDANGQAVKSNMTVDDSQMGSLNLWSSNKINDAIATNKTVVVGGTGTTPACVNQTWFRATLDGCTTYAKSLLSADNLAIKVPKTGCWLFTFFVYEKNKSNSSAYSIELRSVALSSTGTASQLTTTNLPIKTQSQLHRIMNLNAGDEIDFRVWQQDACGTINNLSWTMQELL